jgi:hypothetical protein
MVLDFVYRELAGESTGLNCRALAKQYLFMGIGPLKVPQQVVHMRDSRYIRDLVSTLVTIDSVRVSSQLCLSILISKLEEYLNLCHD